MVLELTEISETRHSHSRRRTDAEKSLVRDTKHWPEKTVFEFDVAIVGLGYVGLPTALAFSASGFRVLGLDASDKRLSDIAAERVDLLDDDRERLARSLADPAYVMTSDLSELSRAAAVIVCVPTPVDQYLVPDLTILRRACASVVNHAVRGQVLMLTSTTYVGSTRDMLVTPLAERGLTAGSDVFVAFSPERINPGSEGFTHEDVPRVVGGATPECTIAAAATLRAYVNSVHLVSSMEAAEMTKLMENIFRAVNIALANELGDVCLTLGLDIVEVIKAAATKPYGFMAFYPGPGVGGHCIPCDPHYLLWQLHKERLSAPIIEQAMTAIAGRPRRVVDRVRQMLSEKSRGVAGTRVLVVGAAYKANVEDIRESPALEIIAELAHEGATVDYYDPLCPVLTLPDGTQLASVSDPAAFNADVVVLHTAHDSVDLSWLIDVPGVLDTTYRLENIPQTVRL